MLRLATVVGYRSDPDLADRLHDLAHAGKVEILSIEQRDAGRGRLRVRTDRDTDCAISQPRGQRLDDGAVLLLDADRAIVVRVGEERWLTVRPRDAAAALQLGYHAGNLHWRVRFAESNLQIAVEGPEADVIARLREMLDSGAVAVLRDD